MRLNFNHLNHHHHHHHHHHNIIIIFKNQVIIGYDDQITMQRHHRQKANCFRKSGTLFGPAVRIFGFFFFFSFWTCGDFFVPARLDVDEKESCDEYDPD